MIHSLQWCIKMEIELCIDAAWKGNCLCFPIAYAKLIELSNTLFRAHSSGVYFKDLEILFI